MIDIQVGDTVYDEKGEPCKVTRATDIMINRPCYRILFDDGTEIKTDAQHLAG